MENIKINRNILKELKSLHKAAVLTWLLDNDTEQCFFQRHMAKDLFLSIVTIKTTLNYLQDNGYIVYYGVAEGMQHYSVCKIQDKTYNIVNG